MKKVSIIMGIYNCENTLVESIESIINQTYNNWELIMCDDGSSDNTYSIAQNYSKKYPDKVKLIRNPKNLKLAATLNNCLKEAEGEYIARMDADDICMRERLEKQVEFLNNNPQYQVVGSRRIIFNENGEEFIRGKKGEPNKKVLVKDVPFAHPTIMMSKEVYSDLGGYTVSEDVTRCEDMDLWFRFFKKGYKGYNLEEPLLKYREYTCDYKKRKLKYGIETMKVMKRGYKDLGVSIVYYPYCLKPVISALVPNIILAKRNKLRGKKINSK